jgi:hypothetical protein
MRRRLVGGEHVGSGTYGCVVRPPLSTDAPGLVGKLTADEAKARAEARAAHLFASADADRAFGLYPLGDPVEVSAAALAARAEDVAACPRNVADASALWELVLPAATTTMKAAKRVAERAAPRWEAYAAHAAAAVPLVRGLAAYAAAGLVHTDIHEDNVALLGSAAAPRAYAFIDFAEGGRASDDDGTAHLDANAESRTFSTYFRRRWWSEPGELTPYEWVTPGDAAPQPLPEGKDRAAIAAAFEAATGRAWTPDMPAREVRAGLALRCDVMSLQDTVAWMLETWLPRRADLTPEQAAASDALAAVLDMRATVVGAARLAQLYEAAERRVASANDGGGSPPAAKRPRVAGGGRGRRTRRRSRLALKQRRGVKPG